MITTGNNCTGKISLHGGKVELYVQIMERDSHPSLKYVKHTNALESWSQYIPLPIIHTYKLVMYISQTTYTRFTSSDPLAMWEQTITYKLTEMHISVPVWTHLMNVSHKTVSIY